MPMIVSGDGSVVPSGAAVVAAAESMSAPVESQSAAIVTVSPAGSVSKAGSGGKRKAAGEDKKPGPRYTKLPIAEYIPIAEEPADSLDAMLRSYLGHSVPRSSDSNVTSRKKAHPPPVDDLLADLDAFLSRNNRNSSTGEAVAAAPPASTALTTVITAAPNGGARATRRLTDQGRILQNRPARPTRRSSAAAGPGPRSLSDQFAIIPLDHPALQSPARGPEASVNQARLDSSPSAASASLGRARRQTGRGLISALARGEDAAQARVEEDSLAQQLRQLLPAARRQSALANASFDDIASGQGLYS